MSRKTSNKINLIVSHGNFPKPNNLLKRGINIIIFVKYSKMLYTSWKKKSENKNYLGFELNWKMAKTE